MSEAIIQGRLDKLAAKMKGDPIFAHEAMPFLQDAEWTYDGDGLVIGTLGPRVCEIARDMVSIGRSDFPGRKRIPL